jgi:hypothetical protein
VRNTRGESQAGRDKRGLGTADSKEDMEPFLLGARTRAQARSARGAGLWENQYRPFGQQQ